MKLLFKEPTTNFSPNLRRRRTWSHLWSTLFLLSTTIGILALIMLILSVLNSCFGFVALEPSVSPSELGIQEDFSLAKMDTDELLNMIQLALDKGYLTKNRYNILEKEKPFLSRKASELVSVIQQDILRVEIKSSWSLFESLFQKATIQTEKEQKFPHASLKFRSWLNLEFLTNGLSSMVQLNGIHQAILGSLWIILITIACAFPVGLGTAIYLEEYSKDGKLNRLIQTNIYNLAGVPSIIYGILGLAIFVRAMKPLTSGELFGISGSDGRTILAAGLTLSMLVLPIIIINAQEAFKAVPQALRSSSYAVGATKWQTIWHHVLPFALDRILTGSIFAISRALGETAPVVVVGASAFLTLDPDGFFSKFTTLPIQIYTLSLQPQQEYRRLAAAGIVVLIILLLSFNAVAIFLRHRIRKQKDLL